MINLLADFAWAFIVLMFWAGLAVVVVAGALAIWLELTHR